MPLNRRRPDAWWQRANVLRERMVEAMPAPHVVWLSDADVDAAAHQAPDLWNWREAVLSFAAVVRPPMPALVDSGRFDPVAGAEAAAVADRLRAIESFLQTQTEPDLASAHLLLEASRAYKVLGSWKHGKQAALEAASLFSAEGDSAHAAAAAAELADVLWRTGELERAMQVLSQDVLPVYERLGDVRSKAVTMGQIADILQARGQLDEALRIRTEEELPVYERLGDVRSKAVTMSKIADILQARGQFDEALRIRTEEQLPVYERLGDVGAKAVTKGKIADILQGRGQLDEALRILTEEVQPAFERLGDVHARAVTMGKVADIVQARGQLDEALALHRERLPSLEKLGDQLESAAARYSIAKIMLQRGDHLRGDYQQALKHLQQAFETSVQVGHAAWTAAIGSELARVLAMQQQLEAALRVLAQAESACASNDMLGWRDHLQQLRSQIESSRGTPPGPRDHQAAR
jgi:tetratricopeptide (TPR) repeat protein